MNADEFRAEGWSPCYPGYLPAPDAVVEFARETAVHNQPPWFGKWSELPPEFNVAGLWWRDV